jgi:LemA protein
MKNNKLILIIVAIVIAFIIAFVFGFQSVNNKAISYEERIDEAKSEITVQEKRRADLIPNLVDCVQAYDQHEYETLMAIVNTRGMSDGTSNEIQFAVNAVAEAYPELKSSENYRQLMTELAATENLIANYRSNYNSIARNYNQFVRKFPNKQILSIVGYDTKTYPYLNFNTSNDAPSNIFGD